MKAHIKLYIVAILIFIFDAGNYVQAENHTPSYNQVHVALIGRCLEFIVWPDESNINQFRIGLLGANDTTAAMFYDMSQKLKIRGKQIKVNKLTYLPKQGEVELLYIGNSRAYQIAQIWQSIEKTNILLVTDRCTDKKFIMLNTTLDPETKKTTFEINRANSVIEGFKIEPELLLLGGTEVDVRMLYRKMRDDLISEEKKVIESQRLLSTLKSRIDTLSRNLQYYNTSIEAKESILTEYIEKIETQQNEMNSLSSEIQTRQQQLDFSKRAFQIQEKELILQRDEIDKRTHELAELGKQISEKEKQLKESKLQLEESRAKIYQQTTTLGKLSSQLKNQQLLVLTLVICSILLLALGFVIFIALRIKTAANQNLESNVARRTEELNTINARLISEMQERERMEIARQKREKDYREIYNSTNEALIIHDTERGTILDANLTFEKMYGYTLGEIKEMTIADLSSGKEKFTQDNALVLLNATQDNPQLFEWQAKRKNGEIFWVEVALHAAELGGEKRAIAAVRDISQRKASEEKHRILEESLNQAEKLKSLGQLAGGIAHDFNNQLAGILGYADILNDELMAYPELQHYTRSIMTIVERSKDLTTKVLAFARKGNYLSVPVDLHKIIDEVVSLIHRTVLNKITIQRMYNCKHLVTKGDPSLIQNALLNVVINARDAMPDGGEITISTNLVQLCEEQLSVDRFDALPGCYCKISIQDSGCGMDHEILKRIFEPFFTTKSLGKGTGMGLAAVFGTVKAHKGIIKVGSEIGKGSRFELYFPLENVVEAENITATEKSGAASDIENLGIMVVDDEFTIQAFARSIFSFLKKPLVSCSNGKEALEFYSKQWKDIDLIILDMIMPEMGGKELFFKMKEINPDLVVIIASGYSIEGDAQELLNQGARGFIPKPYRKMELLNLIADILKK